MSTTLISFLMAAAFKFDSTGLHWFWSGRPQVAIVLVVLGIVLGASWLRSERSLRKG